MKRITMLFTVKSVLDSFEPQFRAFLGENGPSVKVNSIYDDFLATDPAETGCFSMTNKARLYNDLKNAEMAGADLIVCSCSTLTPIIEQLRPLISVPVIAIDDAMTKKAVSMGRRIGLLATASSTLEPTRQKLLKDAAAANVSVEIEALVNEDAIRALKSGDVNTHDILVTEMAEKLHNPELIVLAQASMAHLDASLEKKLGIPVLSSPKLCFEETLSYL